MQVKVRSCKIITHEEFFLDGKALRVSVEEIRGDSGDDSRQLIVRHFKTWAERLDDFNFLIKTRGIYRGGIVATYRLPTQIGPLEELYGVVGEHFGGIVENIIKKECGK